jgi:putative ABC transport system substrate-binding protein
VDWREAQLAARGLRLVLVPATVNGPADLEAALGSLTGQGARALLVWPHPLFLAERERLAAEAGRTGLALLGPLREFAEAGALLSLGPAQADLLRLLASYVDRILKGAKLVDLKPSPPARAELVINLGTAKRLGLEIPASVLTRADQLLD